MISDTKYIGSSVPAQWLALMTSDLGPPLSIGNEEELQMLEVISEVPNITVPFTFSPFYLDSLL